ncbi:hypothetical protein BH11MYX3_BH11MYX3_40920 [soil metagenome]
MTDSVLETVESIARQSSDQWHARLLAAFPDDVLLRRQALLWLYAGRAQQADVGGPDLGPSAARYDLAMRIDHGATATVWQAYDRKLGRNVAIKVFHAIDDLETLQHVIAEARAASDVVSDHVVRILDVDGDGAHPYIVMELVAEHDPDHDGLVLGASAAAQPPSSVQEAARWVMQVARGVHDAHLRNVFHRDLKPQNVLVTPISRRARIADFGLAISDTQRSTCNITVRGTPEYIAPEHARGLPSSLDPRSVADRARLVGIDVWGLGAIAFHLLTGRALWVESGDRTAWEVAASGRPPKLPPRSIQGDRIPARLRSIVERALAPERGLRYANAAVVANELQAFLERRPTSFDRSRVGRLHLWGRRNPQLALTILVSIGLGALTTATHRTLTHLQHERARLAADVADATAERDLLDRTVAETRAALATNRARLRSERDSLAALERTIEKDRRAHEAILAVKDAALRRATKSQRAVLAELETSRNARENYEALAAASKRDAERLTKERDRARKERETVRGERDALQRELDAVEAELESVREPPRVPEPTVSREPEQRGERGRDETSRGAAL